MGWLSCKYIYTIGIHIFLLNLFLQKAEDADIYKKCICLKTIAERRSNILAITVIVISDLEDWVWILNTI